MEINTGLVKTNQEILNHIKCVSNQTSRFSAASKLGLPVSLVEQVCNLNSYQVQEVATSFAEREQLITCSNLVFGKKIENRALTIDSFFQSDTIRTKRRVIAMNVKTESDLGFALLMSKIIRLGGSPSDLQSLFPNYFGLDENNSSAKALRVYKDLRPAKLRVNPKRVVSLATLLKTKSKLVLISDFTKLSFPAIKAASKSIDLTTVFITCYESWLDNFEEQDNLFPSLNFQQAFAIFRNTVNSLHNHKEPLKFIKCDKCDTHYPILPLIDGGKNCGCPYC